MFYLFHFRKMMDIFWTGIIFHNQNLNVLEMLVYVILDSVSKMVTVRVTQFLQ